MSNHDKQASGLSRRAFMQTGSAVAAAAIPAAAQSPAAERLHPYPGTEKKRFSFLMSEDFLEKHNMAWRIETGERDPANPLIEPRFPWDEGGVNGWGSIMKDPIDGLWKAWYICTPKSTPAPAAGQRLAYAESEDGVYWTRPLLDLCPFPGHPRTNLLLDLDSGGPLQQASVLVHPDAPRDRRYEMFVLRAPGYYCPYRVVHGFPLAPGKQDHVVPDIFSMYRYKSADGKRWEAWEALELETADSLWINQADDGSYVALHKKELPAFPGGLFPFDIGYAFCRMIARRTSPDGKSWSRPELVLTPDWRDAHDTQFMEITTLPQRGGTIGVATVYHALNQTIDVQFTATRDGKRWWRPDRRPCVPLRPLGDYGGGMIWPLQPLLQENGRIYLYYSGTDGLHGDFQSTLPVEKMARARLLDWPHRNQGLSLPGDNYSPLPGELWTHGAVCRVSWPEGRLWAAVTASGGNLPGTLMTDSLAAGGKRLEVNAVTVDGGELEAELVRDGQPIQGFSRADCLPFRGDERCGVMRWKGGDRCLVDTANVRFHVRRARLYGFDWSAGT